MRFALLAMLALSMCGAALAQSYPNTDNFGVEVDRNSDWYQACMRVEKLAPPPAEAAAKCDASGVYYSKLDQAVTSGAEWAAVRSCALVSGDTAVLSMLYANGLGVPRDTAIATNYVCRTGAAVAEMDARVRHLATLAPGAPYARYDHCDDITSGMMGGVCAAIAARRAERVETAFYTRLRAGLPPAQAAAFDRLRKANQAFAKAHGEQETARGGSGYAGFVIDAQARETEWLREHLAAFEKGVFSLPPPSQFAIDDAELNRVFGERMKAKAEPDDFDVAPAAIRSTQRSWLIYRDAWVAFAALRYPQLPADSLKALLTQWRIKQLGKI
ncbi:MAG: hypothetical protein JWP59_677 [Massilia sp.]|jgi:hypothetical protein|nr:hypothetical protein [Massilia sp.]